MTICIKVITTNYYTLNYICNKRLCSLISDFQTHKNIKMLYNDKESIKIRSALIIAACCYK